MLTQVDPVLVGSSRTSRWTLPAPNHRRRHIRWERAISRASINHTINHIYPNGHILLLHTTGPPSIHTINHTYIPMATYCCFTRRDTVLWWRSVISCIHPRDTGLANLYTNFTPLNISISKEVFVGRGGDNYCFPTVADKPLAEVPRRHAGSSRGGYVPSVSWSESIYNLRHTAPLCFY